MNNHQDINERLEKLAYKVSRPFCMGCYIEAPQNVCPKCGSDDLARFHQETRWVSAAPFIIEALIEENLTPVDTEEAFSESVREIYPETTQVAWLTLDTASVCREQDPVSWRIARGEWEDASIEDELITTFDNSTYYWTHDIEQYLDQARGFHDPFLYIPFIHKNPPVLSRHRNDRKPNPQGASTPVIPTDPVSLITEKGPAMLKQHIKCHVEDCQE